MAHSGKEDLESGKMLYFEIILCNDYIGLVSVTWQNAALVAGGQGGVLLISSLTLGSCTSLGNSEQCCKSGVASTLPLTVRNKLH